MGFTYYGDLIGLTSLYKQDPKKAYKTLDDFYDTAFNSLSDYLEHTHSANVYMFSDSIVFCGDNPVEAIKELEKLYLKLVFNKNIIIKGAMVSGRLQFDPRIQRMDFEKKIPRGTELVRAVCLENQYKGARFVIEDALVEELLEGISDWKTVNGYIDNIAGHPFIDEDDFKRRIIPVPEGSGYEYLYFWPCDIGNKPYSVHYDRLKNKFSEIAKYLKEDVSKHYSETLGVLKRSLDRSKYSYNSLRNSQDMEIF